MGLILSEIVDKIRDELVCACLYTDEKPHPFCQGAEFAARIVESYFKSTCCCYECNPNLRSRRMFLCEYCGNKRCPHAASHNNECNNSNEPGQKGSLYE